MCYQPYQKKSTRLRRRRVDAYLPDFRDCLGAEDVPLDASGGWMYNKRNGDRLCAVRP
jgi:hypothetical protein